MDPFPCGNCGFVNLSGEDFCGQCAIPVETGQSPVAKLPMKSRPVERADRRHMTVMFCDMVGSTALSGALDAEDLRDVMTAFQDTCRRELDRMDGFIARYMGDGMLVYFGYPTAQEDDAERAVRAGLAIVRAVADLKGTPVQPRVRIGIATGEVIAGDLIGKGASEEAAVVGETPNLAARLQSLCAPGMVVISGRTQRLVSRVFELEDFGHHSLKGFAKPVQAWRAIGVRGGRQRFDDTPLIGRDLEVGLLENRWKSVAEGDGQVVLIQGAAGTGKSRLVASLSASDADTVIHLKCSRHTMSTPLHPLIANISEMAGLEMGDDGNTRAEKVVRWVETWSNEPAHLRAIGALLSIEGPWEPLAGSPADQKQAIFAALERPLESALVSGPVCVLVEDAQWADQSTLELIGLRIGSARAARLLVVVTYRPEWPSPWPAGGHITVLPLGSLPRSKAAELVRAIARTSLRDSVVSQIVARADGVPAFIEELTRAVEADPEAVAVPETLHASLMAKLDRLGDARHVAQAASVLGREFDSTLLARVLEQPHATLSRTLDDFANRGLIAPAGPNLFAFKLALVRDVAYGALLKKSRKHLHARVADLLISEFADATRAEPELAARHLTNAGRKREAAEWWARSAERAMGQAATDEAISCLECAIGLVDDTADSPQAQAQRVHLRTQLGLQLRLHAQFDLALEVLATAIEIATDHDLVEARSSAHFAAGNVHFNTGSREESIASQHSALADAETSGSVEVELQALGGLGDAYQLDGRFAESLSFYERCIERADALGFDEIAAANAPLLVFHAVWALRLEQAPDLSERCIERARRSDRPRSLAVALHGACLMAVQMRDLHELERYLTAFRKSYRAMGIFGETLQSVYTCELHALQGNPDAVAATIHAVKDPPQRGPARRLWTALALAVAQDARYDALLDEAVERLEHGGLQWSLVVAHLAIGALVSRSDIDGLRRVITALQTTSARNCRYGKLWIDVGDAALGLMENPGLPEHRSRAEGVVATAVSARAGNAASLIGSLLAAPVDP